MSDEDLVELRGVDDPADAQIQDIYIAGHPVGDLLATVYKQQKKLEHRIEELEKQRGGR